MLSGTWIARATYSSSSMGLSARSRRLCPGRFGDQSRSSRDLGTSDTKVLSWFLTRAGRHEALLRPRSFLLFSQSILFILRRSFFTSPCVDVPKSFAVPDLVHEQQTYRHQSDDNHREGRSAFGQRDNEDQNRDDDLNGCITVNGPITPDFCW